MRVCVCACMGACMCVVCVRVDVYARARMCACGRARGCLQPPQIRPWVYFLAPLLKTRGFWGVYFFGFWLKNLTKNLPAGESKNRSKIVFFFGNEEKLSQNDNYNTCKMGKIEECQKITHPLWGHFHGFRWVCSEFPPRILRGSDFGRV